MDEMRWSRVQALFHTALDRPPEERADLLRASCDGDEQLVADVLALIDADGAGAPWLDKGVGQAAAGIFTEIDASGFPQNAFGLYRIKHVLGEGGMGVVYLAEHSGIGSLAAIKILRDAWLSPARRDRFAAEQRLLAHLNHPSIALLHHADTLADGTPWFVMEYVEGVPLTEYCRTHGTSIEGRLELFRAVCEAVQHAHGHAVIHRDLKPSNILVRNDGTVKLLDFGIAKQLESVDATVDQTRTNLRLMTPAYAAPEQIRGERVGIHTDTYALGVILYELLTNRLPFDLSNRTPSEALSIVADAEPERPSAVARRAAAGDQAIPRARANGRTAWADLDVLCLTAMRKDPQRRYQTVEALIRDINHYFAGEPLEARPDSLRYRMGKFVRRHRSPVIAAAAALTIAVGLVVFYTVRLTTVRNLAVAEAERAQRIQRFMLSLFEGGDASAGPSEDLRVATLIDRGVQEARGLSAEPGVQAELYGALGEISQRLGNFTQADTLLQTALDQRRVLYGGDHPDVAASLVALGLLRADQAKYDDAERLARSGLEQAKRLLPPDHPEVAAATAAVGHVLVERGTYAQATVVLDEAVRLYSARQSTSPELADALYELSNAHFYQGHWADAESLTKRVLAMHQTIYGARHPHVADDLVNLGAIQHEQGRYKEAERYYRDALTIIRSWFGPDHHRTGSSLTMLGRNLVRQQRFDEADALLEQALAIQERVFGPDHPRVASAVNDLGAVALQRDAFDDAEAAFRRMAGIYRKTYPKGHYLVGIAVSNLASVYLARKEYAEAERLFRDAIKIYRETLSDEHLNTGIARVKLGRSLLRQGRHAEAETELAGGYEILKKQTASSVSWQVSAREDLVAVYDALRQPDKAAGMRAEIAAVPR
ncbi:MAG TPA: serine/threonine-protein kinase [Vicinamibacterales bacterium]|jgi:serine/threonine-protein kinase|nr:serine/threonine-protein kinase [Vicinamibacterales bacterium]